MTEINECINISPMVKSISKILCKIIFNRVFIKSSANIMAN